MVNGIGGDVLFAILGKLSWFFKQQWKRYALAIFLLVFAGVLEMIPPKLIGMAIDEINIGTLTWDRLQNYLLTYGALLLAVYFITYIWMYQLFGGAFLVERMLRSKYMKHLLKMTSTFYERNRTGDLMARATNDLKAVSMTAGFGILTLVDSTAFMIIVLATMSILISWKLTLAAILPLPLMALAMNRYGKIIHKRFTAAQDSFGDMNDQVLESIAGVRVTRAYVQERADQDKFRRLTEDVYNKNIGVAKIDVLFEPTIKVLVGISYLIGLGYGAYLVFHNALTLGELVSFNVYLGMLIWPMIAVGELINIMQRGNASLDRVNKILNYEADVKEDTSPQNLRDPGAIEFDHITFTYPSSEVKNLDDISFTLSKGETLGIVGRTGSGKTTLLKQLLREYPPGEGEVKLSGVPIQRLSLETLQGWIGYVPQDQILFSRTVKENILFGRSEGTDRDVDRVLRLADIQKDISILPSGLDTLVGEKGVALSGGQKQRVSIARALMINPEILILDDAMSAVDGKTEAQIISNIRNERAGKTTLIATHRLSGVQHADRIIVLEEGKVIESGTHQELIKQKGWYSEQFDRQQLEDNLKEVL